MVINLKIAISWNPKISTPDGTLDFGTDNTTTQWLGVWRDYNLVPEERQIPTLVNASVFPYPIYLVDNVSAPAIAQFGLHPWDQFDTDIDLGQAIRGSAWRQPSFGFPFDKVRVYSLIMYLMVNSSAH